MQISFLLNPKNLKKARLLLFLNLYYNHLLSILMYNRQAANPHRTTRTPIVFSRNSGTQPVVNKTKYALCFLCLFDGLRTPSIRRLVRKARTICQKPLVTFDPSCFAPGSMASLQEVYKETLNCPCEITVDPTIQTVLQQLRRSATSMPPQRLLIHYYGQGSHIPSDGNLYFFSEDHSHYKPLKISTMLNNCACPLSMIFECSNAATLLNHLKSKQDLFAFFSCDADEYLPLSTDSDMDLFSSCLLSPFNIALKWHMRRHNKIYNDPLMPTDECLQFLKNFFHAVLSAILYDSQDYETYQMYTRDPSVASLARGFVLAQRVMLSFNIHPVALPPLESMESHPLWSFWDIALDCGISMDLEECSNMVFKLFVDSFKRFPNRYFYPIFTFFLQTDNFHLKTAQILLNYLDNTDCFSSYRGTAELVALSSIPGAIAELTKPSYIALICLAKIIASGKAAPYDQNSAITFSASKDSEVLKAGILALCCTVATSSLVSFNKLTQLCIDHAIDCAPFSSLLLGSLIERAGRLMNLPFFGKKYVPFLDDKRSDIRAAAAYLLGFTRDQSSVQLLQDKLNDESYTVRFQSVLSLIEMIDLIPDVNILKEQINKFLEDKEVTPDDRAIIEEALSDNMRNDEPVKEIKSRTKLFSLLLKTIQQPNFFEKYTVNVFDAK